MGTGGIGFTIGSSKTTHDRREAGTTQSQSASTIGSTAGNVSITAGKQAHISGSDVIANRDISITGDSVVVDPGHDRRTVDEKFEQKKSGLTVALSGTVGSAINNAVTSAQETKESSDSRLKALQATKTALSGVQAGQAATMASATGDPNAMGVSLSLTTQKSKSQQHSESDTVSGSTLNAGNNLSVVATGKNRGDKHTQLDGAVIASTATPDKNHLDTGTLGFSDLHNEADYKVSHSGISLSGGGSFGDKFQGNMPGGMISAGGHSGHAEGTTQAAVADGTITIRDRDNQKQNLANLSRDPAHANDSISPIFDKEKEQRRLQTVGLISDIGSQVADIARTQGELNALKAAKEATSETLPANATEKQRQEYLAKLRDTQAYRNEMAKYGTGSEIQRGIQAATAALQGLAGGNLAGALAGASAPELAHLLKSTEKDPAVNAIAHAILGGAVAAMQGNNAAAGAAGAATGELAARAIAGMLYPGVKQSDLSEEQKQTISTLATVSAGLAGGLTGNSTASAAVGAQSGKNAVENNSLSAGWNNILPSGTQDYGQAVASWNQYAQDNNLTPEQVQEGMNRIAIGEGPSWGTTYKVHPVVQAGGDVSFIRGYTLSGTIDDNHISVNQGDIYSIGAHGGASIGLSFGPYFPGLINSNDNDYSINGGFGVGAVGLSTGKDGVSFTFGFGPSWGWSATEIKGVDVNGTSTSEVYRYDFK
ncbi:ShlA/HecA/FhaA protein [Escherichia coli]|nr:ShlA/HecA/FhaA protein [Escherichia coli]